MLGLNVVLLLSLLPSLTLGSTRPSVGSRASDSSPEAEYPVSVERANDSAKGFGFSHAWKFIVPPNLIATGLNSTTTYISAIPSTGEIMLGDISFGPYTVRNQAFTISPGAAANNSREWNGLLGLGGYYQSQIFDVLSNTTFAENGKSILYNLFDNEPDLPNYIAFYMSRSELGISDGGVLTISEVLTDLTDVLKAPVLESPEIAEWVGYLQKVTVNGRTITGQSNTTEYFKEAYNMTIPEDITVAHFDTGASYMVGPIRFVDQIYGDIQGAQRLEDSDNSSVTYLLPCNTKMNVSFTFASIDYPIHPLDVVGVAYGEEGAVCFGTISGGYFNPDSDWLLGDAFLRNVYTVYGYGASVQDSDFSSLFAHPTTQMLSIVDPGKAWAEADQMIANRLAAYQQDFSSTYTLSSAPTGTARPTFTGSTASVSLTSADDAASATATDGSSADANAADSNAAVAGALSEDDSETITSDDWVDPRDLLRNSWIIIGMLAGMLLLLIGITAMLSKANRKNKGYRPLKMVGDGYSESAPYDR